MTGISIVVPTLNESENIDPLLQRIFATDLSEMTDLEVIVVDDSSTDNTRERVFKWAESHPVKLVCRESKDGLASAVIAGAHAATHEVVLVMDADLSHPPEKISELVQPILDNHFDMVIGSRYIEGGATPHWPASRKIASKLATMPAYLFTDAQDPMAGFFATTRDRLTALRSDVPGFKIGLEVLAVGGALLRVGEVPIVFHDRFEGFSKMNKGVILDYFKQVAQLCRIEIETFFPSRLFTLAILGILIDVLFYNVVQQIGLSRLSSHISAVSVAEVLLFFALLRFWQGADVSRGLVGRHLFGGILGLISSIGLQGAVYQLAQHYMEAGDYVSIVLGSFVGVCWFLALMVVYIFSGLADIDSSARSRLIIVGFVLFAICLRLLYLGLPELMEQEAYYWNYSQHLGLSYLDHPPMVATLIWFGTALFGTNEFAVRIPAFLCWFVTAYFSFRLTEKIFGRTAALGSVGLLAWLPLYYGTGFVMTPDAPLMAAWSALLYFLYKTLVESDERAWLGVGISLGLGMISKYTIVLLGPAILGFMVFDRDARRWFIRYGPYGAVYFALLIFSPVLIWNYQHEWASFLFQGEHRVAGRTFFTTHRLAGYILLILTPAGVLGASYFFIWGKRFFSTILQQNLRQSRHQSYRKYLFLLLMVLSPLLVFLFFSFTREVKLNWTAPLWLAILPFLGCTVVNVFDGYFSKLLTFINWLWKPTFVILAVMLTIAMHYVTFGLPGIPHPGGPFLIGWDSLAQEIERSVEAAEKRTGKRPLVIGMDKYQISSGLAFYRTKNAIVQGIEDTGRGVAETLGWHLFGWDSLMYRYWSDPRDYLGRDMIVVGSTKVRTEHLYFQRRIRKMGSIYLLPVMKDDQVVRELYVRPLYYYTPPGG